MVNQHSSAPELLAGALALPLHDACTVWLSWLAFFLGARRFFSRWLFRDYEVSSAAAASQLLFSLSLAFSLSIFEVVLFELLDVMHVRSRQWVWRVDLLAMTYLLVLVLPLALFFTAAREYGLVRRKAVVAAAVAQTAYLYAFWRLGAALEEDVPESSMDGMVGGCRDTYLSVILISG